MAVPDVSVATTDGRVIIRIVVALEEVVARSLREREDELRQFVRQLVDERLSALVDELVGAELAARNGKVHRDMSRGSNVPSPPTSSKRCVRSGETRPSDRFNRGTSAATAGTPRSARHIGERRRSAPSAAGRHGAARSHGGAGVTTDGFERIVELTSAWDRRHDEPAKDYGVTASGDSEEEPHQHTSIDVCAPPRRRARTPTNNTPAHRPGRTRRRGRTEKRLIESTVAETVLRDGREFTLRQLPAVELPSRNGHPPVDVRPYALRYAQRIA
jgi:hypothetical protein